MLLTLRVCYVGGRALGCFASVVARVDRRKQLRLQINELIQHPDLDTAVRGPTSRVVTAVRLLVWLDRLRPAIAARRDVRWFHDAFGDKPSLHISYSELL
jgi:hypothetical protein